MDWREKRADKRVKPSDAQPITAQIIGPSFLEKARVRDIGARGIGVTIYHDFPSSNANTNVEVMLTIDHGRPFMLRGIIRHISIRGGNCFCGIEFIEIAPEKKKRLDEYVTAGLADGREA